MGYTPVPIGDCVTKITTWNPKQESGAEDFLYVDLSSVDKDTKSIVPEDVSIVSPAEAPSRARQIIASGDVLVSTVRPNLNGVALVPYQFDGATASTGYCVLRPNPSKLDSKYLFYWVQNSRFVELMIKQATGANYPAVSDRVVKAAEIPLPPLAEQKRIAAILDKADAVRRKRQQAIDLADQFLRSVFLEMFGDPVTNPKGWPTAKFGEVGTLDRGKSKHRPRNDPALLGGPYPLIQTGDVANSKGYIKTFKSTYSELGLKQSRMWPAGTLCITIAANIAKTGVLTFDACFPDSVVGFKPNGYVTVEYVRYWMGFLQKMLEANAPESAQKNINLEILRGLEIPVPPQELQEQFTAIIGKANQLTAKADSSVQSGDDLFGALGAQAFSGQL